MGKILIATLCAAYMIWPLDFVPDFIPVIGWADDLLAAFVGLKALFSKK